MIFGLTPTAKKKLRFSAVFFRFFFATLFAGMSFQIHSQADDFSPLNPAEAKRKREAFIAAALAYRGTPYVRGGNSKAGIDCSGLVCRAGVEALGVNLPRTVLSLEQYAEKIAESEREPGDLVFFNTTGRISHVGIYIGDGEFVHAASDGPRTGVIVSNLSENYWSRTYRFSARILPAVESEGVSKRTENGTPSGDGNRATGHAGNNSGATGGKKTAGTSGSSTASTGSASGGAAFKLDFTGTVLWDFEFGGNPIRGVTASASAHWLKGMLYFPGITAGFSWDARQEIFSMPLYVSLTGQSGLGFFVGAQFVFYSGEDGSKGFFFPGIIGVSWTSKTIMIGSLNVAFYQSAEYLFVPDEEDKSEELPDGFRLATGLTFVFPK